MYLDASALVKLVLTEVESGELRSFIRDRPRRFASRLAQVEVARAIKRAGIQDAPITKAFLGVEVIELAAEIAARASTIEPRTLRLLDAVHLASALAVAEDLEAFVTYDSRLGVAARRQGLPVVAPA